MAGGGGVWPSRVTCIRSLISGWVGLADEADDSAPSSPFPVVLESQFLRRTASAIDYVVGQKWRLKMTCVCAKVHFAGHANLLVVQSGDCKDVITGAGLSI